jgi:hypothetical protein
MKLVSLTPRKENRLKMSGKKCWGKYWDKEMGRNTRLVKKNCTQGSTYFPILYQSPLVGHDDNEIITKRASKICNHTNEDVGAADMQHASTHKHCKPRTNLSVGTSFKIFLQHQPNFFRICYLTSTDTISWMFILIVLSEEIKLFQYSKRWLYRHCVQAVLFGKPERKEHFVDVGDARRKSNRSTLNCVTNKPGVRRQSGLTRSKQLLKGWEFLNHMTNFQLVSKDSVPIINHGRFQRNMLNF